jgi:hypothetical protein
MHMFAVMFAHTSVCRVAGFLSAVGNSQQLFCDARHWRKMSACTLVLVPCHR